MRVSGILAWEVVPARHSKYVYMVAGAVSGGIMFAFSQSWFMALSWDMLGVFLSWAVVQTAEPVGAFIVSLIVDPFRFFRD